jgi:menaquinone-9 beta-reductase
VSRASTPWDAVVVGAGPAGAATAARLAGAGQRVLLLDRDRFPRAKPCGECVNPAAVQALDDLGVLDRVRAGPHRMVRGWRIHPVQGEGFEGRYPAGREGLAVSRALLDAHLLERAREAGAEFWGGVRVGEPLREAGRVTGVRLREGARSHDVRARLVVGADGLRSVLVRRLELLRRGPRLRKVALTAHVQGIAEPDEQGELHLRTWGCVGLAGVADGVVNAVVVLEGRAAERVAGAREEFFDAAMREHPRTESARRVGEVMATGPFDWPTRSAVVDGALLVGDAAGYYDPFTGQGIYRALRGAELAAAVAGAALDRGDTSAGALAPYERARRRAFLPGERVQKLIEQFVSRPALLAPAASGFRRHPPLADALMAVIGDLAPVSSLLRPRNLRGLVSGAAPRPAG